MKQAEEKDRSLDQEGREEREELSEATWSHVAPFAFWIAWILLWERVVVDESSVMNAWMYAIQSIVGLSLFLYYEPWRWYGRLNIRNIPLATAVGVGVFVVWILPETGFVRDQLPRFHELYLRYGLIPPWDTHEATDPSPYSPVICGWALAILRLMGSAFVIAFIEEFFWRGFLYRWMQGANFLKVDIGRMDWPMFLLICLVFASVHVQWLVAIAAGAAYLWLMIHTRDIWAACIAHVVTNFILGIYVLATGSFGFW